MPATMSKLAKILNRCLAPSSHPQTGFEPLEPRQLMSADLPYTAYYPEGFASGSVKEFVPLTNTNGTEVQFELHARYEWGERDQLISSGRIAPDTRGGVTIWDTDNPDARNVRPNTPYALVLKSSLPLAATMSHYDFGTAIGESFSTRTSDDWSFAEGQRDDRLARTYFLVYNPSDTPRQVQLELFDDHGGIFRREIRLEAQRRGGWSINDIAELGTGRFSARIHADGPIVAAQSEYELQTQRGFGALGTPDGGATAGVLPAIEYENNFYDRNGDDPTRAGATTRFTANSFISVLNSNTSPTTVTLTFLRDEDALPPVVRTLIVAAKSRTTLSIRDTIPPTSDSDEFGVVYRSTLPVTLSGSVFQGMDATGVEAGTVAATCWTFGEGFMSRSRGGRLVLEDIYLFNPTARETTVTLDFMFTDGQVLSLTKRVDGLGLEDVSVHKFDALRLGAESRWYGIRVTSSTPIVASMEHWDGSIGGGFSTFGMPCEGVVSLSSVLAI